MHRCANSSISKIFFVVVVETIENYVCSLLGFNQSCKLQVAMQQIKYAEIFLFRKSIRRIGILAITERTQLLASRFYYSQSFFLVPSVCVFYLPYTKLNQTTFSEMHFVFWFRILLKNFSIALLIITFPSKKTKSVASL